MLAIVDAGPLYAVADASDDDHQRCLEVFQRRDLHLVIAALAVAEATFLIGRRLGALAEAKFLSALGTYDVEAPTPEDWGRISELVESYADFPLGGTDASVIALAERLKTDRVVTLDVRHFSAVRPRHSEAFVIMP